MNEIKIIECPRDAMQGIKPFIPTEKKVKYIQSLLRVGFDTIDFGSFVSPKAIPQMQDTVEVLAQLDLSATNSKLLAIIANTQGAQNASVHKEIQYLGFPFSISENFQMRNTHKTIAESLVTLLEILEIADKSNKEVVTYISMGFGNPYGDPWNVEIVGEWTEKLANMGVKSEDLDAEIDGLIRKVQEEGISEKDFAKLQNIIENDLVNQNSSMEGIAQNLADAKVFFGNTNYVNEVVDLYRKVTREDIARVARQYLNLDGRVVLYYLPKSAQGQ